MITYDYTLIYLDYCADLGCCSDNIFAIVPSSLEQIIYHCYGYNNFLFLPESRFFSVIFFFFIPPQWIDFFQWYLKKIFFLKSVI